MFGNRKLLCTLGGGCMYLTKLCDFDLTFDLVVTLKVKILLVLYLGNQGL